MARFLIRRAFSILISIIGATIIIFTLTRFGPDPVDLYLGDTQVEVTEEYIDMIRAYLGVDKSLPEQYGLWVWHIIQFDMGESIGTRRPVSELIRTHIGTTLKLAMGAWIFAVVVGLSMGVLSAVKRATFWDYVGRGMALVGQATPQFWTGVMAILIFAVWLGWFPAGTLGAQEGFPLAWHNLRHWILPCIVLGWPASAGIMRLTRSSMLETLDSEYIKLARAKGVGNMTIIWKHGLRNAVIPPLTSALVLLADYMNGALVVEIIFSLPGIGTVALNQAVYDNDWPLLAGTVLVFIGIYVSFAFIADIAYAIIDPRIRYS
ncbi:MAG: ABC transporter permease [SAR202 cluster bacterium]|jgi:peptide/nickel transport system permease protein|nr:ABC transporter permease [SAR202 cluster bacterium]MDP6301811.1 ABC transporter permease [SAR202 cluster bacterium]MDP7104395.1 ABC transporter permease [SAR202 cluster bacterium]MDP7223611.1 ABC transporter permease [SAR202 cluster bacterium]MDP7412922.1 ABC transporter permease [SAR202 cluster bacterium]|tara:strand:- start:2473 stop:3432 length:960 start_codon:yes stop_codon:yes gene_type:complete